MIVHVPLEAIGVDGHKFARLMRTLKLRDKKLVVFGLDVVLQSCRLDGEECAVFVGAFVFAFVRFLMSLLVFRKAARVGCRILAVSIATDQRLGALVR